MAPAKSDTWRLIMGSGFNTGNTAAKQIAGTGFVQPNAFTLDPTDGDSHLDAHPELDERLHALRREPGVRRRRPLRTPYSKVYQEDNVATLGLQADLNGRIWFLTSNNASLVRFDSASVGIDASAKVGQSQPIYYNPAASGYGQGGAGCVAYAFGSGTLYERSTAITGTRKTFIPRLYVATRDEGHLLERGPGGQHRREADPRRGQPRGSSETGPTTEVNKVFGERTQLTAPPFMLVPKSGTGTVTALYLLYDPDEGVPRELLRRRHRLHRGRLSCQPTNTTTFKALERGRGRGERLHDRRGHRSSSPRAASARGQRAGLYEPPGIAATVGGVPVPRVKWWKELK